MPLRKAGDAKIMQAEVGPKEKYLRCNMAHLSHRLISFVISGDMMAHQLCTGCFLHTSSGHSTGIHGLLDHAIPVFLLSTLNF